MNISYLLIQEISPVILVIFIGLGIKKTILKDEQVWSAIDQLNFKVLIPCLIISTLLNSSIPNKNTQYLDLAAISILSLFIICILLWLFYKTRFSNNTNPAEFSSMFQTATRWNVTIAIILVEQLFSQDQFFYIAVLMLCLMPIINLLNISVLTYLLASHKNSILSFIILLIKNPILMACLLGLLALLTGFNPPKLLKTSIAEIGQASIGITLLSLGAGINLTNNFLKLKELLIPSFLKLICMPALVFFFGKYFHLEDDLLIIIVIALAAPTAMNGYSVAKAMGGDAPLYANIAALQTLMSFLTIPLWALILGL